MGVCGWVYVSECGCGCRGQGGLSRVEEACVVSVDGTDHTGPWFLEAKHAAHVVAGDLHRRCGDDCVLLVQAEGGVIPKSGARAFSVSCCRESVGVLSLTLTSLPSSDIRTGSMPKNGCIA